MPAHRGTRLYFFLSMYNSYSRIDLFLADQWLLQKISSSEILPITWSDHSPICMTIEDNPKSQGFEKSQKCLKMTFYAAGKRAGKLLTQQIKGYHTKSQIPHLYHPTTREKLTNPQAIADALRAYYSAFYNLKDDVSTPQPDHTAIQTFLDKVQLPSLTDSQLELLNSPFTPSEINKALNSLPNNKSPGLVGFVGEYYKQFKDIIIDLLTRLFNAAAFSASFPDEMLITLIV